MIKKVLLGVLLVVVSAFSLYKISKSTSFQFTGDLVDRVDAKEKIVALTFDDGPTKGKTEEIIRILNDHKVSGTFYLVGESIEQNIDLAGMLVKAGHEVGNHSFTHGRLIFKSYASIADEIEKTSSLIRKSGFEGDITFRPPYGKKLFVLPYYLAQRDITSVTWDVAPDSDLPVSASPDEIANYAVEHTRPGSIILLHVMFESRKNSLAAVPTIIERLRNDGYRFVTVSELIRIGKKGA
ncbi:polysaccharide deacetylase family protein [Shewanella cyperi]|uniref:Polysaccharide deacetylase family protein n=1 Tax=Shewanella cyperi TaxID=2814292 RepID=A0A975ALM3_9GAMM|nr:polysaccharide deacetylase family protein [Shewanella cyperi]QSX31365.1 polysaccharide deacetylase family protein [Shewanella cyperi]